MQTALAVGPCLEHPEVDGAPCARCGTFRCEPCLERGLCPPCRGTSDVTPPGPGQVVGFGTRAGARIVDTLLAQVAGLGGGLFAGMTLGVLSAMGIAPADWTERLDHGTGFNFLSGYAAVLAGMTVSLALCGTSPGKALFKLRVVRTDGHRAGWVPAFLRELAYFVDALFFGLVGKSAMDRSPLKQRHGDAWAGTLVVTSASLAPSVAPSTGLVLFGLAAGFAVEALILGAFFVGGVFL